jgi:predicted RNA methylase
MSKITKQQLKQHEEAEQLLWGSDRPLNRHEVEFCLEHWDPRADSGRHVAHNQAYFTPMVLACEAAMYVGGNGRRVVDICAGTGRLAYAVLAANGWQPQEVQVTAVEFNPEFVRVGRRLLPEVDWILGDCYDLSLWQSLPRFDEAISNPPFGKVVAAYDTDWVGYRGPAGLTVAAIGLQVARLGIKMILPQAQTIFRYSGADLRYGAHADSYPGYLKKFMTGRPGLEWDHTSLDTEAETYKSEWRGAAPVVEVVSLYDPEAALLSLSPMPAISRPVCSLALTG